MAEWWEKLGDYLEEKWPDKNQGERAKAIGVSAQSLSQWLRGDVKALPPHMISSVIDAVPEFDANYFFREGWPPELPTKKPPHQGGAGAGYKFNELLPSGSVQKGDVPDRAYRCLGYAFGPPGSEQLIVDFLIVPADERVNLPIGTPRTKIDEK